MLLKEYFEKLDKKKVDSVKTFFLESEKYDLYENGGEYFCKVNYEDGTIKYYYQPGALMCESINLTKKELSNVKKYIDDTDSIVCESKYDKETNLLIENIINSRKNKILNESLRDKRW